MAMIAVNLLFVEKRRMIHTALASLAAVILLSLSLSLPSRALLNLGWIDYVKSEYDESAVTFALDRLQRFQTAAGHIDSPSGYWLAGRLALGANDNERAARLLAQVRLDCDSEPLFVRDYAQVLQKVGRGEELADYYVQCPSLIQMDRALKEMTALAILKRADRLANAGHEEASVALWRQILQFRPFDLYANYYLWTYASHSNPSEAASYLENLVDFSADAVQVEEADLAGFLIRVVPELLQKEIWNQAITERVASFLVVEHYSNDNVQSMIERLIKLDTQHAARWLFLMGEFHQRRGNAEAAIDAYQSAYTLDTDSQMLAQRLAAMCVDYPILCEDSGFDLETHTFNMEAEYLRLISEQAGVPAESVELGENQLPNGSMEKWEQGAAPANWFVANHADGGQYWNLGSFVARRDNLVVLDGQSSALVTGFWNKQNASKSPAGMGYWMKHPFSLNIGWLNLSPGKSYWVGFSYLPEGASEGATVAAVQLGLAPDPLQTPIPLIAQGDFWHRTGTIICVPPSASQNIMFLIKSHFLGRIWFDDLGIWEIAGNIDNYCEAKKGHEQ